ASSRTSITVQDILTASQGQMVPEDGYQHMLCSRIFPMLWSIKTHIQNSTQGGYSCKMFCHRQTGNILWEKEQREQETAAPKA
ncbi:SPT46 protein, partial [Alcedo cyanopectus]|nr:SPT46 protein [Ceyx cyanopectus]